MKQNVKFYLRFEAPIDSYSKNQRGLIAFLIYRTLFSIKSFKIKKHVRTGNHEFFHASFNQTAMHILCLHLFF